MTSTLIVNYARSPKVQLQPTPLVFSTSQSRRSPSASSLSSHRSHPYSRKSSRPPPLEERSNSNSTINSTSNDSSSTPDPLPRIHLAPPHANLESKTRGTSPLLIPSPRYDTHDAGHRSMSRDGPSSWDRSDGSRSGSLNKIQLPPLRSISGSYPGQPGQHYLERSLSQGNPPQPFRHHTPKTNSVSKSPQARPNHVQTQYPPPPPSAPRSPGGGLRPSYAMGPFDPISNGHSYPYFPHSDDPSAGHPAQYRPSNQHQYPQHHQHQQSSSSHRHRERHHHQPNDSGLSQDDAYRPKHPQPSSTSNHRKSSRQLSPLYSPQSPPLRQIHSPELTPTLVQYETQYQHHLQAHSQAPFLAHAPTPSNSYSRSHRHSHSSHTYPQQPNSDHVPQLGHFPHHSIPLHSGQGLEYGNSRFRSESFTGRPERGGDDRNRDRTQERRREGEDPVGPDDMTAGMAAGVGQSRRLAHLMSEQKRRE
jgi:hypothetical protein